MRVLLLLLLSLTCTLQAQLLAFDPEKSVSLELVNGEKLFGRIIDTDSQQLHLVGAKVNRLIPFALLRETSRTELNLIPNQPAQNNAPSEFKGLNSTRSLLKESQEQLALQNRPNTTLRISPYTVSYPFYPVYYHYPYRCHTRTSGFSTNIQIHF